MDHEPPPAKKRRFNEDLSSIHGGLYTAETSINPPDKIPPNGSLIPSVPNSNGLKFVSSEQRKVESAGGFDVSTFEAFVGEKLDRDTIRKLREVSGDNMERAINMYFESSWRNKPLAPSQHINLQTSNSLASTSPDDSVTGKSNIGMVRFLPSRSHRIAEWQYIGAFGAEGWATRSGSNLIKPGEKISIERQKIIPPAQKRSASSKLKLEASLPTRSPPRVSRGDVIVRFTNSRGEEIGRLQKETAAWVSTLIDQKICKFEGSCVYVPDQIRTNDTVYLQLRCSLLRRAFEAGGFKPANSNRTTGIFEEKESNEEKDLRLRQIAMVKLFDEIKLLPFKTNEKTTKYKRQGLLQAAEVAEQYEKIGSKKTGTPEVKNSQQSDEDEEGKELEQDQLDSLYKKAQSFDFNMPKCTPPDTFVMDLRAYQKQALHWMLSKEMGEKNAEASIHPLWEEYQWPTRDMDDQEVRVMDNQKSFYVNPYSGEMSLDFPVQEQNCLGGILADEMGLGKTIEMLSLVHTHKSEIAKHAGGIPSNVNMLPRLPKQSTAVEPAPCTTLVVAPMSLLAQWQSEAEKASKEGTLKSIVYYGSDKTANLQALCCESNAANAPNLIITSYGVVLSEFNQVVDARGNRGSHGGLFSLQYFRVILDEAHHIKNRQSKSAKACYEISAIHRWVLTGTPIVNRLEDLFSLVRFLRVEPWSNFSYWKTFITVPFESKNFLKALDVVQTVLEPLVLRRTKDMQTPDGDALVSLPPKKVDIEEIELSKSEREVYDYIFARAKNTFNANMEAGTLLKSYTMIFAQILRLRQSCCHPVLTRNKTIVAEEEQAAAAADAAAGLADDMDLQSLINRFVTDEGEQDANKFGAHVLKQIQDEAGNECPICSEEPMLAQTVTGCWHSACKKCLLDYIEHQKAKGEWPRCFNCREMLSPKDIFEVIKHDILDPLNESKPQVSLRRIGTHSSAKIDALITHLKRLRRESPGLKSVVFSQFTSFLDLIEPALERDKLPFLRFDGSMAQKQRAAVLKEFAAPERGGTVLLLSLRAGGVGLNLTHAKRVFMMDPWWSFAIEAQAIDRVHRMGQDEPVLVHRFIVKNSVEQRMLRIQDRKKFIASSLGMMSDEEKKLQTIDDIKELLS
ncbi:MAG: DNA helicase rad5 [Trizodia sp. TS-e1964]|nr:MAG: DNA helicase rad5 [Trizodia sp. TS-e1964]